jgi:hypothetical protein
VTRSLRDGLAVDLSSRLSRLEHTYVPPQCVVFTYAALGERERALEYQERAYEDGASSFNYLFPGIRALYALSPRHKRRLEQRSFQLAVHIMERFDYVPVCCAICLKNSAARCWISSCVRSSVRVAIHQV